MRFTSELLLATVALAAPLVIAAQNPPPGGGPPQDAPRWGQGQGVGQGLGQGLGPRWQRQMGQRRGLGMGPQMGMRMGQRGGPGLGRVARNKAFQERIGLTPEQVEKIRTQESGFVKMRIRSQADLRVKRMELAELVAADKPDRALIDKKLREINDAEFAARKAAIDHRLTMRDILTPEQKQKLEELGQELRQRRMQQRAPQPQAPPLPPAEQP